MVEMISFFGGGTSYHVSDKTPVQTSSLKHYKGQVTFQIKLHDVQLQVLNIIDLLYILNSESDSDLELTWVNVNGGNDQQSSPRQL